MYMIVELQRHKGDLKDLCLSPIHNIFMECKKHLKFLVSISGNEASFKKGRIYGTACGRDDICIIRSTYKGGG